MSVETQPRSVSQVEQYEQCGHRYYLSRVVRVERRPAAWSHQGTAFHRAAEQFERGCRQMTEDQAVELYSEEYSRLINEDLARESTLANWLTAKGKDAGRDIADRYVLGQEQTRQYARWSRQHEPAVWQTASGELGLELPFTAMFGGVRVRGVIDQLVELPDGSVRPRDHKTGSTKSPLQLRTYGLAARQVWGVEVTSADWYLAREGRLSRPVKMDTTAEKLGQRYRAMDEGVKRGNFPASPGFHCHFCDVNHKCSFFG